nr:hypothetical protein [Tanacetum cinerariifolium]
MADPNSQDKYMANILKKFGFTTVKTASTLIEPNKTLIKDAETEDVSDEDVYTGEDDRVVRAATTTASLESHDLPLSKANTFGSGEDNMEHQDELMDFVPPIPYNSPLSGGHTPRSDEGRPNINELVNLYTLLSNRVLALEQFKTVQDWVIKRLQNKVKRLEKKQRARTPGMKLFKIGTSKKKTLDKENDVNATEPVSTTGDAVNDASVILDVSADGPSISFAGPFINSEEVNDSKQLAKSSKKSLKADHDKESVKKQKLVEDDAKKEELKACLDIVPVDDIAINVESLATKYLIVDWKTHTLTEHMMYYQIIRANKSLNNYKILTKMCDDFDRQDIIDLYRRYETTGLEGYDLLL